MSPPSSPPRSAAAGGGSGARTPLPAPLGFPQSYALFSTGCEINLKKKKTQTPPRAERGPAGPGGAGSAHVQRAPRPPWQVALRATTSWKLLGLPSASHRAKSSGKKSLCVYGGGRIGVRGAPAQPRTWGRQGAWGAVSVFVPGELGLDSASLRIARLQKALRSSLRTASGRGFGEV